MNEQNNEILISSTRNENNAFNNSLKISLFFIVFGIIGVFIGDWLAKQTREESELYLPILILCCGGVLVLAGIALPFIEKSKAKIYHISVYKNAIDGKAMIFSQGSTNFQILDFHENTDVITSVSTATNLIVVNLKDGRRIQCPADNAEEIANVIRKECIPV